MKKQKVRIDARYGKRALSPRKISKRDMPRLKRYTCPNLACLENRSINIIDMGRGARECRTCGTYYLISEHYKRS